MLYILPQVRIRSARAKLAPVYIDALHKRYQNHVVRVQCSREGGYLLRLARDRKRTPSEASEPVLKFGPSDTQVPLCEDDLQLLCVAQT